MKNYFLFDSSYYLMQNSFFTTSDKRCSKTSLSVWSQIYAKMWKTSFTKFFFILKTNRLFLQPLVNCVQKPVYRYEVKFMQKCGKPFSQNFSSYSKLIGFFTTSLYIIPDPIFLLMLLQEKLMVFPILFLNHQRK